MNAQLQTRVTRSTATAFAALAARKRLTSAELMAQAVKEVLRKGSVPKSRTVTSEEGLFGRLKTSVSEEVKAAWLARAASGETTSSAMLRAIAESLVDANPLEIEEVESTDDVSERKRRMRLELFEHEAQAINQAAVALGWKSSTWLVSVARTALFQEPRPTNAELAVLMRSNRELLAIGRNLNQLAHALHRDDRYKDSVTVEKLDALRANIKAHVERSQALLEAIENRWKPEKVSGQKLHIQAHERS
ncbi:hypothetical protein VDR48_19845 [Xanthomonas campestris pv. campestris]|nr:hypothetical protein [Xanthomonas campestris pv. campestris]MEB1789629.1 hypothetical protein [Xanthomonas campestris pv. campestris]MEB1844511.1 hypothetical protein [Xanthomonas campestris pv. campestris]MEB1878271.1 hypothetical protein [Xanthomonas campestris pv. campestris]